MPLICTFDCYLYLCLHKRCPKKNCVFEFCRTTRRNMYVWYLHFFLLFAYVSVICICVSYLPMCLLRRKIFSFVIQSLVKGWGPPNNKKKTEFWIWSETYKIRIQPFKKPDLNLEKEKPGSDPPALRKNEIWIRPWWDLPDSTLEKKKWLRHIFSLF